MAPAARGETGPQQKPGPQEEGEEGEEGGEEEEEGVGLISRVTWFHVAFFLLGPARGVQSETEHSEEARGAREARR